MNGGKRNGVQILPGRVGGPGSVIHLPAGVDGASSVPTPTHTPRRSALAKPGQPSTALSTALSVTARQAAWILGISRTTLWRCVNLPKNDPRRIKRTSYNTYPIVELQRHITAELEKA